MKIKILLSILFIVLTTSCSTANYQARGHFQDASNTQRQIVLQWSAQRYYLPFIDAEVDYGSVSLQAECLPGAFLDYKLDSQHGLVFVERSQRYTLVESAPKIVLGNYIVCAKLANGTDFDDLDIGDSATLSVFCKAKPGETSILPANVSGYTLQISRGEEQPPALQCVN